MTSEIDEFRKGLVAAVQAELERHASAVVAEVDRLREEGQRERAELREEMREQLSKVTAALEQGRERSDGYVDQTRQMIEQRMDEAERRQNRRLDDATAGLDGLVAEAMRPLATDLREENEALVRKVDGLDTNLRKFDEQAARMVTYFNTMTSQIEERQDELAETVKTDVAQQIEALKQLVEENDSSIRRFQNEVGQSVSQKVNDAEDRFNNRLLAAESRIKDDAGQQIADIQAHVGRVSSGLDETMTVLNERIGKYDDRFGETDRRIEEIATSIEGVDQQAIEDIKEKVSSAAGEAMLVRIEMERMEKSVAEKTDGLAVRMTDVETQLQDYTMDVSTAVQLDRLEEIERALGELDPDQFVRKDGTAHGPTVAQPDMFGGSGSEDSVKNDTSSADGGSGPDIGAIIAAAEGRSTDD